MNFDKKLRRTIWFLTYPKCDVSLEDAQKWFLTTYADRIVKLIVARELHKDGTPHLHVYVEFKTKIKFTVLQDIQLDGEKYHGNYQPVRTPQACRQYCTKEGDFLLFGLEHADMLMKPGKKEKNMLFLCENPITLVDEGHISLLQLPQLLKSKEAYFNLMPRGDNKKMDNWWIFGPPGTGKTYYAMHNWGKAFYKDISPTGVTWFLNYQGELTIVLDEVHPDMIKYLDYYLKTWSHEYEGTGQTKGSHVVLRHERIVVTSNFSISECYPSTKDSGPIRRRFTELCMKEVWKPEPEFPMILPDRDPNDPDFLFEELVPRQRPPMTESQIEEFFPTNSLNCFEEL